MDAQSGWFEKHTWPHRVEKVPLECWIHKFRKLRLTNVENRVEIERVFANLASFDREFRCQSGTDCFLCVLVTLHLNWRQAFQIWPKLASEAAMKSSHEKQRFSDIISHSDFFLPFGLGYGLRESPGEHNGTF